MAPGTLEAQPRRDGGSGFLVERSEAQWLITSDHVLAQLGTTVEVIAHDDDRCEAQILAREPTIDLALAEIRFSGERPGIAIRTTPAPRVGEPVLAMGSSFGFEAAVTAGILSSVDVSHDLLHDGGSRSVHLENLLVTDALIGPGNSGGPVLDIAGRAIGLATGVKVDQTDDPSGFGFAIPGTTLELFVADVLEHGRWQRGTLRLHTEARPLRPAEREAAGAARGLAVLAVLDSAPTGGRVRTGDVLVALDGEPLDQPGALLMALDARRIGVAAGLGLLRDGRSLTVSVTPAPRT